MAEKFYYKSPIGILEISLEKQALVGLKIVESREKLPEQIGYFAEVEKQLDEYFSFRRKEFNLNISLKGTEFQKSVWTELLKIPYGKTKSYREIAKNIGKPNAQRAVGMACNKNPILLIIPCQRVVAKNGDLTGFASGVERKAFLLCLEAKNPCL